MGIPSTGTRTDSAAYTGRDTELVLPRAGASGAGPGPATTERRLAPPVRAALGTDAEPEQPVSDGPILAVVDGVAVAS